MAVHSFMVPLGSPAPDFAPPRASGDGRVRLTDFGTFTSEYAERGLATVSICANDVACYPDDDPAHLVAQATRAGFGFPYLVDEDQLVALAGEPVPEPHEPSVGCSIKWRPGNDPS